MKVRIVPSHKLDVKNLSARHYVKMARDRAKDVVQGWLAFHCINDVLQKKLTRDLIDRITDAIKEAEEEERQRIGHGKE